MILGVCVQVSSGVCDSRGLGPGGVLSELAVVDGEIRTKVAAELQRTDGAEREREREDSVTTATTQQHCSLIGCQERQISRINNVGSDFSNLKWVKGDRCLFRHINDIHQFFCQPV